MQPAPSAKNKSNIMRLTLQAKKRARRRLIGSIFLLLIALMILLNITSKVRVVPVDPRIIEIKNTGLSSSVESVVVNNTFQNSESKIESLVPDLEHVASGDLVNNKERTAQIVSVDENIVTSTNVEDKTNSVDSVSTTPEVANISDTNVEVVESKEKTIENTSSLAKLNLSPRIVNEKAKAQLTPEQILNGEVGSSDKSAYFIQLLASNNKTKVSLIQKDLNKQGFRAFIQEVNPPTGGVLYRLRMGPFASQQEANSNLKKLNTAK